MNVGWCFYYFWDVLEISINVSQRSRASTTAAFSLHKLSSPLLLVLLRRPLWLKQKQAPCFWLCVSPSAGMLCGAGWRQSPRRPSNQNEGGCLQSTAQVVSDFVAFTAGLWSWQAQGNWFAVDLSLHRCVFCAESTSFLRPLWAARSG